MKKSVHIKKDHLIMNIAHAYPWGIYRDRYYIELNKVNTPEKVEQWRRHLSGKSWATKEMLSEMVDSLARRFGWDVRDLGMEVS